MTSFIESILNFLSSLFGGKKETTTAQTTTTETETVKVNTNDYEIPQAVTNGLTLAKTAAKLTDEEVADLEEQIKTMGSLGHTNYVMHTHNRKNNLYWEMKYLNGAKTMDFVTQYNGFSYQRIVDKGLESLIYENLLS